MAVTISDVARLAGVSKAAVSAVLNDRPGISQATRERILEIVNRLNYRPSQVARSLSIRQTRSIGLVIKEIDNPYFSKVMKGVFDTCAEQDFTVLLGSSELSPKKEKQSIDTLVAQRVDGLILASLQGEDVDFSYLSDLIRDHYPLVTMGSIKNYPTSVVEVKNVEGAFEAVNYLIRSGHKRIAYFSGPSHSSHSEDRAEGYRRAFLESRLPFQFKDVVQAGSYIENGYEKGKKFFSGRSDYPSAVFCYNDLVAIGLINALTELGLSVPVDVSVIGFDDIDFVAHFRIPLTTIHVPAYEIGKVAAEMVIGQIAEKGLSKNTKQILDVELIVRNSVSQKKE